MNTLRNLFSFKPSATKKISQSHPFYDTFPFAPENISTLDASIISELAYREKQYIERQNENLNDYRDAASFSAQRILENFSRNKKSILEENGEDFDKKYPNTYAKVLIANGSGKINMDGPDGQPVNDSKVTVKFHEPVTGGSKKSRTRKTKKSRKNKKRKTRKY